MIDNIRGYRLLYRGTRDGFKSVNFRNLCSNQGSTVTIVQTKDLNRIFGGFTDIPWSKDIKGHYWDAYKKIEHNHNSFLFKLDENN